MRTRRAVTARLVGLTGIALVGVIDYASGTELRVYPLYFGPVGLLAWHSGRAGALAGGLLSAFAWLVANGLAGMRFSTEALWAANTAVHGTSFVLFGLVMTALRDALAKAQHLSRTDPLTGLFNSRAFEEDAAPVLSLCRRTGRPVTLAYIDLDHFKSVNDRQGHQAGDALLRATAEALHRSLRSSDVSARLGGDEFAVLFPEAGAREAAAALERIRATLTHVVGLTGVTVSIGAITCLRPPLSIDGLSRRADALMYAAKEAGRDRVMHEVVDTAAPDGRSPTSDNPAG